MEEKVAREAETTIAAQAAYKARLKNIWKEGKYMYRDKIFPGVETVYDYFEYLESNRDVDTYSSTYPVRTWDEFEGRYVSFQFNCGCTGSEAIYNDNSKSHGFRMPFIKIEVEERTPTSLLIDQEVHEFQDKIDACNFKEFAREYNSFIDYIIGEAIEESFRISDELYYGGMENPSSNFINMFPQQFFVEVNVYKAMVRHISWRDHLFAEYFDFDMTEIRAAYDLIHDKSNESTFNQIYDLFMNFVEIIASNVSLPEEMQSLVSFFLMRKAVIDTYTRLWLSNYCAPIDGDNTDKYIESCVQNSIVTTSDETSMALLTYYMMSCGYCSNREFYEAIQEVFEKVSKYEKEKNQALFRQQLFKNPIESDSKNNITINDVDFMNGSEFENLVCKLFKKMGFKAYVTKQSGDQGIDVIVEKDSIKIGIQAKCYSSAVGNSAIQEAVAGKAYYGCNRVMVVTNNSFTKSAEDLAAANSVVLWGRDILKEKLIEYPTR